MPLFSASSPRKRLLVHLSQAVETLALKNPPSTVDVPLEGDLDGNVKVQFFEVSDREFRDFEKISKALAQLDQGTYGRCTHCGKRIDAAVLTATPLATLCLACGDQEPQP